MIEAEELAQKFHEAYERLAPDYGYETRKESAKPWLEVPEKNRRLMTAVCASILSELGGEADKLSTAMNKLLDAYGVRGVLNGLAVTLDRRATTHIETIYSEDHPEVVEPKDLKSAAVNLRNQQW